MSLLRRRAMMESQRQEIPIGVDLADIYGVFEGKIINSDGSLVAWQPGIVSQYIPCSFLFKFELKTTTNSWSKVAFYDSEKIFIPPTSSLGQYGYGTFQFGKNTAYEIPENAKYFIVVLKGTVEGDYYVKRIE